ncbi:MAG: hypothetical protein R6U01_00985 [Halorubrum sp.]|uniref:hypothetical protein n=1 Tax=Halorubrum sp. TaxID=1879286 RepID=UPI0039708620
MSDVESFVRFCDSEFGTAVTDCEAAYVRRHVAADARARPVVCFAHVTNQTGQTEEDFEKGEADGSRDALEVIDAAAAAWRASD